MEETQIEKYLKRASKLAKYYDTHGEIPVGTFPRWDGLKGEVATLQPKLVTPKNALFDTIQDPNVYTLEIDNKLLTDFQKLRQSKKEDIRKTLLALIDYHSDHDSFNLILLHDVLETRQSYTRFTAQLGNYLTHGQQKFTQIKVQFDSLTSRLGIFCRLGSPGSTLNSSFLGSVTASLCAFGSAEVLTEDIPMSYLGNQAALKYQLTQRLGKKPNITWTKTSVKIFA